MANGAKVVKIRNLLSTRENVLKQKILSSLMQFERINLYIKKFKNSVCADSLMLAKKMIEKIKNGNIDIPEKLANEIVDILQSVFYLKKVKVYINSDDKKLLVYFFPSFENNFDELDIISDDFLNRGECRLDYSFLTYRLGVIQRSKKIEDTIFRGFQNYDIEDVAANEKENPAETPVSVAAKDKNSSIETLEKNDINKIIELLLNEDPKIIAVILSNFKPENSAKILWAFPPEFRYEVINRLAHIDKVPKNIIENIGQIANSLIESEAFIRFEFEKKRYLRKKEKKYENLYLLTKSKY